MTSNPWPWLAQWPCRRFICPAPHWGDLCSQSHETSKKHLQGLVCVGVWRKMLHHFFSDIDSWLSIYIGSYIMLKYFVILPDCQEGGTALHDETLRIGMKSGHNDSRDFWNAHSIPVATWPAKIVLDVNVSFSQYTLVLWLIWWWVKSDPDIHRYYMANGVCVKDTDSNILWCNVVQFEVWSLYVSEHYRSS